MPLTKKGHKIMAAMKEKYGEEDGERVFYASANAGKITGVHKAKAKDGLAAVADADGHVWTREAILFDNDTEVEIEDGAVPSRDGYLKANARVARVGLQSYRGHEVGLADRERVILYRPPDEVFSRDSMRSHASKPITLTHPARMVDKTTWGKVAKGFSGNEVMRDGEFVRVPLMLTDAAAIEAFESGAARELSVGYSTDIDWTAGVTPDGRPYDGVQRDIRTNHHALVPVARGGDSLRFGDADPLTCRNCGAPVQEGAMSCPSCGYDLKPTPRADDRDAYQDSALITARSTAAPSGTAKEGAMPIVKSFDNIPIQFVDEVSAAAMEREVRRLTDQIENLKGKKAKPFGNGDGNGNGDGDDADETEAKRKKEKMEDALNALKVKDGEIAVLKKQIADAGTVEARAEALAEQRIALLDAAKPLLPKDFKDAGKSLADIRRIAVSSQFSEAEIKDWDDSQFIGAFAAMTKLPAKSGAAVLADGMSRGFRDSETVIPMRGGQRMSLADAEKDARLAYNEYCERTVNAYKNPMGVVRN